MTIRFSPTNVAWATRERGPSAGSERLREISYYVRLMWDQAFAVPAAALGFAGIVGAVLVALTVFGVAMFFLANYIGGGAFRAIQNAPAAVAERVAPVGRVRLDGDAIPEVAAAPAPAPAAGTAKPGDEIYAAACAACHTAGVAGAG